MSPPSPPDPEHAAAGPDWVGRIVGGRYRVDAVLGQGGMGTAYRAYDQELERLVVLKAPHARHFSEGESRGRFQDEIRKLIAIEHPHVVRVYGKGEEGGTPYAVFQYLSGGSLGARMRALGHRLTPDEVVPWLMQVAEALDDLHRRGELHRDVKPDNILFDRPFATGQERPDQGKPNAYLADFGLAKALGVDPARIFESQTGTLIGTQAYMAPEQFSRQAPVTGAVDQYALATTIYQALSGQMPFAVSSSEELAVAKAIGAPRSLSEVAKHVTVSIDRAVMKALSADPKARFRTCGEFAAAVAAGVQAKAGEGAATPPVRTLEAPGVAEPLPPLRVAQGLSPAVARGAAPVREGASRGGAAPPARRRSPWPWIAAVVGLLGGLGGAGAFLGWFGGGTAPSRTRDSGGAPPSPVPVPVAGAGMETPPPTPPSPAPVTPPVMEADPAPAAMATVPPAEPAMVETPPAPPVVPVAPAWKAHMDAAKAAARLGDWVVAGRELDLALEKEVPGSEVPKFLEDGVRDWRAPATLTITSPSDPTTVTAETVEVRWTLSTSRAKDAVSVTSNGKAVPVLAPGRATVGLVEGENRVEIVVRDEKDGERAKESVRLIREKDVSVAPPWAKVSADQIAEAKRLKVPVAFENSIGMRFVLVPAGTFTMGSPPGEASHQPNETQHQVTLTRPLYVSMHETTNGQYRRFKEDHESGRYKEKSLNGDAQPVVRVAHDDAARFAAWLSSQEQGTAYRLPTEAEWEYAARAGTTSSWYWGDDEGGFPRNANIADRRVAEELHHDAASAWDDGHAATAPAGSFLPNRWGLYDMIGNVWEACSDWEGGYSTRAVSDPSGPSSGTARVVRGGSLFDLSPSARAAFRGSAAPDARDEFTGFRLVLPVRAASTAPSGRSTDVSPATPPAPTHPGSEVSPTAPLWAKVSSDQIAEAKRLKVPVAFENSIGMRFVLVPAGTFTMGSPEGETGRNADETQHRVTLTQAFYVSIHETTNGQYRRFKKDHDSGDYQEESLNGDTQPVGMVSHTAAVEFAAWLSGQESVRTYRLPTEAEWEYACRAGTTTRFSFGDRDEDLPRFGNIWDKNHPSGSKREDLDDGRGVSAPVGTYGPNGWGLHDMHGNVCEMCSDWTEAYPTGPATDPRGPPTGTLRVARGGSWHFATNLGFTLSNFGAGVARSAFRGAVDPDEASPHEGFRLVVPARVGR